MQAKIEAENLQRARENQALQNAKRAHKKGEGFNPELEEPSATRIRIGNSSNFLITFAKCCSPRYPDPIAGYVSRARGITVHRADCPTYARIQDLERRRIEVEWDREPK